MDVIVNPVLWNFLPKFCLFSMQLFCLFLVTLENDKINNLSSIELDH